MAQYSNPPGGYPEGMPADETFTVPLTGAVQIDARGGRESQ